MNKQIFFEKIYSIKKRLFLNWPFFVFFLVFISSYLLWWLAFFPGNMSPDSISQWREALSGEFTNASPYFYATILYVLRFFFDSPAVMGLFQLTFLSVVLASFFNFAWKSGIKKPYILISAFVYILLPHFGVYNVTLWKDVLFAYTLFTLMLVVYFAFQKKQPIKISWLLVALIVLVPLFRFNGLLVIPLVPLLFLIFKKIRAKSALILFLTTLTFYLVLNNLIPSLFGIQQAPLMKEGIFIKAVGAIYNQENPNLSISEKESFKMVMSEEDWKEGYLCWSVDPLFYEKYARPKNVSIFDNGIDSDPSVVKRWHNSVLTASLKNPGAIIRDKACLASYLFGVRNTLYKYEVYIWEDPSRPNLVISDSKAPRLKDTLHNYLLFTSGGSSDAVVCGLDCTKCLRNYIFWGAWIPILAFLFFGFKAARRRLFGTLSYVLIMMLNLIGTALVVPAASFRYIYVLYVAVFILPILYILEDSKNDTKKDHKSS
jgi:hypothetical protein